MYFPKIYQHVSHNVVFFLCPGSPTGTSRQRSGLFSLAAAAAVQKSKNRSRANSPTHNGGTPHTENGDHTSSPSTQETQFMSNREIATTSTTSSSTSSPNSLQQHKHAQTHVGMVSDPLSPMNVSSSPDSAPPPPPPPLPTTPGDHNHPLSPFRSAQSVNSAATTTNAQPSTNSSSSQKRGHSKKRGKSSRGRRGRPPGSGRGRGSRGRGRGGGKNAVKRSRGTPRHSSAFMSIQPGAQQSGGNPAQLPPFAPGLLPTPTPGDASSDMSSAPPPPPAPPSTPYPDTMPERPAPPVAPRSVGKKERPLPPAERRQAERMVQQAAAAVAAAQAQGWLRAHCFFFQCFLCVVFSHARDVGGATVVVCGLYVILFISSDGRTDRCNMRPQRQRRPLLKRKVGGWLYLVSFTCETFSL